MLPWTYGCCTHRPGHDHDPRYDDHPGLDLRSDPDHGRGLDRVGGRDDNRPGLDDDRSGHDDELPGGALSERSVRHREYAMKA